ncbi:MAG: hypothetical protein DMF93_05425 [Acidobacteria bacterium]|nr:MAG: hypothetical protein DMF93_05425 [Acidobacteriota bacterium]
MAETIGVTGGGITAGGGGGGGGGLPRPAGAGGAIVSGAADGAAAAGVAAGAPAAGGAAAGGGAGAAAGAALGGAAGAAGADAFVLELAHAGTASAAAPTHAATSRPSINHGLIVLISGSPAFRASDRSRSTDRRTHPTRICRSFRPARRRTP